MSIEFSRETKQYEYTDSKLRTFISMAIGLVFVMCLLFGTMQIVKHIGMKVGAKGYVEDARPVWLQELDQ
ncbi:hypothetical protein [uncultured Paraglaciecola sp.]|uniref:hypothetical protein n=1 Tax=uncultured Paraglaciecola sp. TaxID=1765024 RepID=UPI00262BA483|nr:hypothetical protein [uncultured Paraglaciecola sp.]